MKAEYIVDTIAQIVASPLIEQYKFGITKDSVKRRRQYWGKGFEHYVIIDARIPLKKALDLEQEVFSMLTKTRDKRDLVYRKYHKASRDKVTARSVGGSPGEHYEFYIAWWER